MREKILAVVILIAVVTFVIANTLIIERQIGDIEKEISTLNIEGEGAVDQARKIHEDFMRKEKFISLTVSHDDLTNIEGCFVELIGYLSIGDADNAKVTKDRLTHSLEHLRRLSTFTIDAII